MSEVHPITFRLKVFNAWRRGNDAPQPDPKTVGEDIDSICDLARRLERELDEARNAMAHAQGDLDLKTLDFERMREQRDKLLKQLAAMESAGAEQARRADYNHEWALRAERERDAERALAEQRGRLYDTAIGQLKKLQAQVDELNDKIRYNEVESSHNWRNRERDREAISAWKEARND